MYKIGLDIGSTTAKIVVLDSQTSEVLFNSYERHQADVKNVLIGFMRHLNAKFGNMKFSVCMTGSVGMGIAERYSIPFVQEVVAAAEYLKSQKKPVSTMIDIGGEDAKIVFYENGKVVDLRMNGNCAGGTGAFIDQMAALLGVDVSVLGGLAEKVSRIYPIASRCGVFCKTDIQNLLARNVPKGEIAASVFHAVAVQTILTLAHGRKVSSPILFCGGPLTFIPALRKAFADYLAMTSDDFIIPENSHLIPAMGAAICESNFITTSHDFIRLLYTFSFNNSNSGKQHLQPFFHDDEEYEKWKRDMSVNTFVEQGRLNGGAVKAVLGIDSGSTTTKIVLLDEKRRLLFSYYKNNGGNSIKAVRDGLEQLLEECQQTNTNLQIIGSCSTGYGEDLIRTAFKLDSGIVETIAHYMAAKHINKDVSFILDIGGQDMKAIFVENGAISRIEVNEACSSGCGSFISTFANSLNYAIEDFAKAACMAPNPCDLGTRCTVFMNSKVKQALHEGATIADIAAGLSYSVVKNCLYKVLQLKNTDSLGDNIIVQGGAMRNDSIVRGFELLTGKKIFRNEKPELMGALGCALYALKNMSANNVSIAEMIKMAKYVSTQLTCHGCENQCAVTRYRFDNSNSYFSGNRCEKIFNNEGIRLERGVDVYEEKMRLLFDREATVAEPVLTIGIPRVLNIYEEYPFWHTLFTNCNIQVKLSGISNFDNYEQSACKVMSDNICFPAKLVHSHIANLQKQRVDRIFMPFVVYEKNDKSCQNSYNCPIVSGYSQVVKSVQASAIPIDSPTISFKDKSALKEQCRQYFKELGIEDTIFTEAFKLANESQENFESAIAAYNDKILADAMSKGRLAVVLAGRPYHSDSLIQHKVSDMIASQGAYVLTDDIVRNKHVNLRNVNYLSQWTFANRILKSAEWVSTQGDEIQYMQLTSFGCGPDAFLVDEVRSLLHRRGKNMALLKIDDVNNVGSLKLRVRSLIESLKVGSHGVSKENYCMCANARFTDGCRSKKIIVPFFTPFISPLIPPILKLAGHEVENLPMSDHESIDLGLKFSNNEVCFPATLVVGDIVKAFKSGRYDPDTTCVAFTQTGGQCRASNYLSLIRKALQENGYVNTPVISISPWSGIVNDQPGFKINWLKIIPVALAAILYTDCISKFYYSAVVREKQSGAAARLRDYYLSEAQAAVVHNSSDELYSYLSKAADDFNDICNDKELPKVGIVGEIYLKFNPFAQKHVTDWLAGRNIEVVPPVLIDFFMQGFVNMKENYKEHVARKTIPDFVVDFLYRKIKKKINKVNSIAGRFRYFTPFDDIYEKAERAREAISLSAQFGEGWLIAGEILTLASQNVKHVVSLQPFGCIANHIVEKGIENRLRTICPQINILSLDFDGSVSDVNITNRLILFIDDLKKKHDENERK